MKSRVIIFLGFIFSLSNLFAQQHWCGFQCIDSLRETNNHSNLERIIAKKRGVARVSGVEEIYTIPVVVHVVHSNSINEIGLGNNISVEQIESAIKVLNDHFRRDHADTVNTLARFKSVAADVKIEFCLATQDPSGNPSNGITRHKGAKTIWSLSLSDETKLKSYGYWPSDEYLNIWVTRLTGDFLGYAYFPDNSSLPGLDPTRNLPTLDGVVMVPKAFGDNIGQATGANNPYKYGRTFIHEVGHWLGLRHTFDDANGTSCVYTDYCEDTPTQAEPNTAMALADCDKEKVGKCGEIVIHQNYMDYTRDLCVNLFTEDQKERMRTVMDVSPSRKALRFSRGCCGSKLSLSVPNAQNFENESELLTSWTLDASDEDLFSWQLESDQLVSPIATNTSTDSITLGSGAINYINDKDLILRFDAISDQSVDSVRVYYERACSGVKTNFFTAYFSNEMTDIKISLKGLVSDGLLQLYIVAYNNGSEIRIDNLQIYEEEEGLLTSIYPNPSSGKLNLNLLVEGDKELTYSIYDLQGKLIDIKKMGIVNSGIFSLDISSLVRGYYILRIVVGDQMKSEKLIIR